MPFTAGVHKMKTMPVSATDRPGSRQRPSGTRRQTRRRAALLLALLLAVLTAMTSAAPALASPATTHPARATQNPSTPAVTVDLTSVTPDSVDANGTITIKGTVTNTSKVAMTWVQVSFWRSRDPITDPSALSSVLSSPITMPVGERWFGEKNEASMDNITDPEATQTFQPGQTASFQVSGTAKEMGLTTAGAYLVGVHVQATPVGRSRLTVGRARVLTVVSAATTKAALTPVVELSSRPAIGLDGTFMDDHLAGELTGRLTTLLSAAQNRQATVLVDPGLVDEVIAMAAGYTVDGRPGTGTQAAINWLAALTPVLQGGNAYRLPYGNADVVGAARAGHQVVLTRARDALAATSTGASGTAGSSSTSTNPAANLPLAVVDRAGALDRPSLTSIVDVLHPQVVLSSAADTTATSYSTSGTTLVPLSTDVLDGGPDHTSSPAQRRGRLLAQALLDSQDGRPVTTVVTTEKELAVVGLTATSTEPWLTLRSLSAAVGTPSTTNPLPARSRVPTVLQGSWWTDLEVAARHAAGWGDVLADPAQTTLKTDRALSRGVSVDLAAAQRSGWLTTAMSSATQLLSGTSINLHAAESFVMSSASNYLPLTVTNRLDATVRVKVVFTSEYPQRISVPTTQVVTIRSGETQTIRFSPRASSNGQVEMTAQLTSPAGRPLGVQHHFLIRATRMDDIGWVIIVISGAVLLGATLLRIHQVRHRQGTDAATLAEELTAGLEEATQHHESTSPTPAGSSTVGPDGATHDHLPEPRQEPGDSPGDASAPPSEAPIDPASGTGR